MILERFLLPLNKLNILNGSLVENYILLRITSTAEKDGIFISQDKYVDEILKKFGFTEVKTAITPIETQKLYSRMKLIPSQSKSFTSLCCEKDFRHLKGQPTCLCYPKDLFFDLVAYTDSDYAGASLDRKSTIGGCQFLGCRLISWQCKKQTVVANSKTEVIMWLLQVAVPVFRFTIKLLDYGDCNEKKLIQMVKIHTDKNVADLLTKAFDVSVLDDEEVFAEQEVAAKDLTVDEVTLAQALAALKSTKPKAKGIVFRKPGESTTTTIPIPLKIQDKGKAKMIEPEPVKKLSKKDQLMLDEELAFKLQAKEEEEEERLAREKAQQVEEVNIAWDDVQAKIEADYQLAQRLQAQEQEELTDEDKARLFVQFLEQRRKHFAAKRAEKKKNRPPTKAQQRSIMLEQRGTLKKQKGGSYTQEIAEWMMIKEAAKIKELMEIVPDEEK
ncbi:hypothetical protein Tco_1182648 [Tanacetum coccineum]